GVDLADTRQRVFHSKRLIERSASWWRRSLSDWQLFKAMLHPFFGAALGVREAASYFTLPTRRTRDYRLRMAAVGVGSALYDYAGVGTVVDLAPGLGGGDRIIAPGDIRVIRNPGARPHVFGLGGQETALIWERPGEAAAHSRGAAGRVVFSEVYYPGWQASVDGKAAAVELFEDTFPSVPVGLGEHSVRFVYSPWSFRIGAGISLAAILAWIWLRFRHRIASTTASAGFLL
ncbi:MAG: YfhO family protein, partial [Elusimicrobiota bacterium]